MSNFSDGNNVYVEATTTSACALQTSYKSNVSYFNSTLCAATKGDLAYNPKAINFDLILMDNVTNYQKGRSDNNTCITEMDNNNVIDAYYEFVSTSENISFDVNVANADWLTSVALIDSDYDLSYNKSCLSNIGLGNNLRTIEFNNLVIGHKYLLRLEIGSTSQIGARVGSNSNAFSVILKKVTGIESDQISKNDKTISNIYNLQGQMVDGNYKGLVIYKYTDGSAQKTIQE